jgi:predicted Rossmann fold nucleotide-binding protein DprA/Smf involved in DNA uptake
MNAALDAGGCVVGVLADALTRTASDPEVRRAVAEERLCLATPYAPSAPFSAGNAMGRNKILYALADVTVVVECEEGKGGTWSGATEALSHGYGDVVVWLGAGAAAANHVLAEKGAVPVDASVPIAAGHPIFRAADHQLHMKL